MKNALKTVWIGICVIAVISLILTGQTPVSASNGNVCIQCHGSLTGRLGAPVGLWRNSIHAETDVACNDCHGGDPLDAANAMSPARGFLGVPKKHQIPGTCGRCHIGVLQDYLASPHGKALSRGGPTCVTCHGNHQVKKATLELINEKDCSRCHDFERASRIREVMARTESRIVSLDQRIAVYKGKGIDTITKEKSLYAARNRFHTLFHELDVNRLKGEIAAIDTDLGNVERALDDIEEDARKVKLFGVAAIAAALLAALLLRLFLKTFEQE